MKLSKAKIIALMREQGISQNALARQIGVSPSTLSNAVNGRKGVGRTVLAAFLRQFPGESVSSLTLKERS